MTQQSTLQTLKHGQYRYFRGRAVLLSDVITVAGQLYSCTISYPKDGGYTQTNRISAVETLQELAESCIVVSVSECLLPRDVDDVAGKLAEYFELYTGDVHEALFFGKISEDVTPDKIISLHQFKGDSPLQIHRTVYRDDVSPTRYVLINTSVPDPDSDYYYDPDDTDRQDREAENRHEWLTVQKQTRGLLRKHFPDIDQNGCDPSLLIAPSVARELCNIVDAQGGLSGDAYNLLQRTIEYNTRPEKIDAVIAEAQREWAAVCLPPVDENGRLDREAHALQMLQDDADAEYYAQELRERLQAMNDDDVPDESESVETYNTGYENGKSDFAHGVVLPDEFVAVDEYDRGYRDGWTVANYNAKLEAAIAAVSETCKIEARYLPELVKRSQQGVFLLRGEHVPPVLIKEAYSTGLNVTVVYEDENIVEREYPLTALVPVDNYDTSHANPDNWLIDDVTPDTDEYVIPEPAAPTDIDDIDDSYEGFSPAFDQGYKHGRADAQRFLSTNHSEHWDSEGAGYEQGFLDAVQEATRPESPAGDCQLPASVASALKAVDDAKNAFEVFENPDFDTYRYTLALENLYKALKAVLDVPKQRPAPRAAAPLKPNHAHVSAANITDYCTYTTYTCAAPNDRAIIIYQRAVNNGIISNGDKLTITGDLDEVLNLEVEDWGDLVTADESPAAVDTAFRLTSRSLFPKAVQA